MDAFFASVELLRYPELRGQAVVVGGRSIHQPVVQSDGSRRFARLHEYAGRGVVTTSTYEARALGVYSGMGLMKSAALAPDAILLPANFDAYRDYSRKFKAAVFVIAPIVEDRGIDEIYIDLTDIPEDTRSLAMRIKQSVFDTTGLTCSIGVSPNKLLSKICSDLEKPNGLTVLHSSDIESRIWPLPAKKINGIGPKASEKLARLGVHTIGQLAATSPAFLVDQFGRNFGGWLHRVAHGIDERPVITDSEPKSISIKLRYDDFSTVTRDSTLQVAITEANDIRRAAGECLKRVPLTKRIRLLGVRAGALSRRSDDLKASGMQPELVF